MLSAEGERGVRVVEARGGAPGVLLVAAAALGSFLAPMHILMTGGALPPKAEEGLVRIL